MTTYLVPCSPDRVTSIEGSRPAGNGDFLLGSGAYWVARKAGGFAAAGSHLVQNGITYDGTDDLPGGHNKNRMMLVAPQPWPTVGGSLVAMCAGEPGKLDGCDWVMAGIPVTPTTPATHYDWCSGYAVGATIRSSTGGLWLAVTNNGQTRPGPRQFQGTTQFDLGYVAASGTYAEALAYQTANP